MNIALSNPLHREIGTDPQEFCRLRALLLPAPLRALVFAPHCTAWVVSKAIQGEHMIRYTANDVLPRIERALAEVRRELALGFRTCPLAPGPTHAHKAGG